VVIEAEHFSNLTPGSNATWKKLPGLGRGDGSVMVSPPDAASHPTVPEILSASPMMDYKFFMRQAGPVTVTTTAIPTLEIQDGQGLRFAVAIDGATPQIVDMARTSGSGSVWSRSVLRSAIPYSTVHALTTPGEHSLKIWMVDPGVVLDHHVISTEPLPYSYDAPPETAAVSHGALVVGNGESYAAQPDPAPTYDSVENHGTIDVLDGSLKVIGDVVNHGTLRLYGDAGFDIGGDFTNHGLLDIMTWSGALPPGFVNNGNVLDRSAVRVESAAPIGNDFKISIHGYHGHGYQLQEAPAGDLATEWNNLGSPQTGTGALILFSVPAAFVQPKRFFRVKVAP
jgi:hypothetical protein